MNILRNRFISTTAMFLAPPDEGKDNTRSDAQKERDAINVSDSTDPKEENKDNQDDQNSEDDEDNSEDNSDDENDDEENDENKDDEEENKDDEKQETEEEKATRLAKEKEERREARIQKRIDRAHAAQKKAEQERDELRKRLEEKPVEGLSEEEVARRAEELANKKLADKRLADAQAEFEKNCDTLEEAAIKEDKDFARKINEVAKEIGPIPRAVIEILSDLDNKNGGEVLAYLADNIDEAEDIYELRDNPRKLDRTLSKLSDKIKEAKKPQRRERSQVPPPIEPVNGGRVETTRITGKESQEEFNAKRAKQIAERNKQRGYA